MIHCLDIYGYMWITIWDNITGQQIRILKDRVKDINRYIWICILDNNRIKQWDIILGYIWIPMDIIWLIGYSLGYTARISKHSIG
jgi:hypothetical protein